MSYGADPYRDGVTLTPKRELQALALPSEIMRLPNLTGYLKLPGPYPVARIALKYVKRAAVAPRFVARGNADEHSGARGPDTRVSAPDASGSRGQADEADRRAPENGRGKGAAGDGAAPVPEPEQEALPVENGAAGTAVEQPPVAVQTAESERGTQAGAEGNDAPPREPDAESGRAGTGDWA